MTNINNIQRLLSNINQESTKTDTNVLIITSVDDRQKILSRLIPKTTETVLINLTDQPSNRRFLSQLESEIVNEESKNGHRKRRKADLTCVVCEGSATGYNFTQIVCESCKAFFRRNALQPIEKTKCLSQKDNRNEVRCHVQYDIKQKCQRCRLIKCFESGMSKDHIVTTEEKVFKKQRLEENRRLRTTQITNGSNDVQCETLEKSPDFNPMPTPIINPPSSPSYLLSEVDWACLHHIQSAYLSALQSSPSASSVIPIEFSQDRMSIYTNTIDVQNCNALKLINFLRQIPEFDQLNEGDRLILVKHNLTLLFMVFHSLTYDTTRDLVYDNNLSCSVSPSDEAFAHHCKSLYILCYGYEMSREFFDIFRTFSHIVDKDPIVVQLLMLMMIFLNGLWATEDQQSLLNDGLHVFHIHSKYTDLLFRYLMERSSFDAAVLKMMRITNVLIKGQRIMRDFHQNIKMKVDTNYINPLMKSLLHLT